jgi:4-hydroxy-tetrahydrodipicolinate synthase
MTKGIAGTAPVLPTPFDDKGQIDEEGFRNIVNFCIAQGVDCLVFPGLASEYDLLTLDERLHLIALLGDLTQGKVDFVVGASGHTPGETPVLIEAGARAGAAAAMVVTPGVYAGDMKGLTAFYREVGEGADVPVMLQNAPKPMGIGLSPAQVLEVVGHVPAIRYVKEENMPCGQRITQLVEGRPANLIGVFGGAGGRYIVDELNRGAIGTMPAVELVEGHVRLMQAHAAGDDQTVWALYERMLPILAMQAVFRWRLTKEVMRRRGLIRSAYTRAPGAALDAQDQKELGLMLARLKDLVGNIAA